MKKYTILSLLITCTLLLSACGNFTNDVKDDVDIAGSELGETADSELKEETTEISKGTESTETEEKETESETSEETPSNSEEPSSSEQPSNTETPSNPEKEEVVLVETKTQKTESEPEAYKYGVTRVFTTEKTINVYSDGSTKVINERTYYKYDTTKYNATDEELKAESDANAEAYIAYYQEVLKLVNEIRAEAGAEPLTLDTTLCKAASMRAIEMDYANYFEHERADKRAWYTAIQFYNCTYSSIGENIAAGQQTPEIVVNAWKNSPGHYKNMISTNYTKLGVGYSGDQQYGYGHYWVQLFSN